VSTGSQRRLRVVYLDHVARLSGGELALLRMLPPLLDRVAATVVLAEEGPLVGRLRDVGVEVIVLPLAEDVRDVRRDRVVGLEALRSVWRLAGYVLAVARLLRRLNADLVHTNSLKAAIYGGVAGRFARVPVVWHVRDRIAPDYLPRPAVLLVRLAARLLPAALIANSRSTLVTLPARRRSAVVGSPVDVGAGSVAALPPERADGALVVGVVGRLAEWKGQHVFLEAFAEAFPDGMARARLVGSALFGEEPYEKRLRRQVEELGIADRVSSAASGRTSPPRWRRWTWWCTAPWCRSRSARSSSRRWPRAVPWSPLRRAVRRRW
jgi:glycosyltransferase involved in cell wall biosynthesis